MKLNIGASPIWLKDGWFVLDHKLKSNEGKYIAGDAVDMLLPDESVDVVFTSHVFEHIPHYKLPLVLAEINRVLKPGGVIRILTPDLERLAKAYASGNGLFFDKAREEDESIRNDLGLGGMFMNFIVSPGQDTVLLDRSLRTFLGGYAHLYCYDYAMLSMLLESLGFVSRKAMFCDSEVEEMREPLHVDGMAPTWVPLNQSFYERNGLVHKMVDGEYKINFKVTGFDRDPVTSLIVEGKKVQSVSKSAAHEKFNLGGLNYNRYGQSLLSDAKFVSSLSEMGIDLGYWDLDL